MGVFFTEEFISEVKSILKSNSHSDCEAVLIDSVFKSTTEEIKNTGCKRLGGDPAKSPFLRKRIQTEGAGKSSGYRLYFWLLVKENDIYLLFIHPKTGRRSGTNLTKEKQLELVKTFKKLYSTGGFYEVILNENADKITYRKGLGKVF